jgi:hypothetical protein
LVLGFILYAVYTAGGNAVRVAYEKRDTEAANEYAKAITEANAKLRAAEERSAELLAAADADYQAKLKEHNDAANKTIADIRSGAKRLYVDLAGTKTGGGTVSEVAACPGIDHGPQRAELSAKDGEFFVSLASECDAVVEQLSAAQQVIISDRK